MDVIRWRSRRNAVPLTRSTVTVASRIMLPTYAVFFAILGLNYLLTPLTRLMESPTLDYANQVGSLRVWALMFLASAALMGFSLLAEDRTVYRYALFVCIICMAVWVLVFLAAAVFADASPAAWVWPAFAGVCCWATSRSLNVREL